MEKFNVHILGCGSALPTSAHHPSCQIVNVRDKLFMVDCAEGAQLLLRGAELHFQRLSHIFISHLHGDHCFGLIGLISTFGLLGRTAQLHLYSPGETLERLMRPWLEFFCRESPFEVVFHSFSPNHSEVIYSDRSVTVTTLPLRHRVPCCGFLFEEVPTLPHIRRDMIDFLHIPTYAIQRIKEGADWTDADGRVWPHAQLTTPAAPARRYAYCSDTMPVPALVPQLQGVDVLYHEATFAAEDTPRARQTGHSTASQAATIARDAAVGRLVVGHFSARYTDREDVILKEAREIFPATILAHEGLVINV